jgi:hypothetical protein
MMALSICRGPLEAQIGDDGTTLVLDHIGTVEALERGFGLVVAEIG